MSCGRRGVHSSFSVKRQNSHYWLGIAESFHYISFIFFSIVGKCDGNTSPKVFHNT